MKSLIVKYKKKLLVVMAAIGSFWPLIEGAEWVVLRVFHQEIQQINDAIDAAPQLKVHEQKQQAILDTMRVIEYRVFDTIATKQKVFETAIEELHDLHRAGTHMYAVGVRCDKNGNLWKRVRGDTTIQLNIEYHADDDCYYWYQLHPGTGEKLYEYREPRVH